MNPKILATAVGGQFVLSPSPAHASLIEWGEPASRQLEVSWSSDIAEKLAAYLPNGPHTLTNDKELSGDQLGPLGGVLLHQVGRTSFEVNPTTGEIFGVVTNRRGQVVRKSQLVDLLAGAPEAFKAGGDVHVLVTTRRTRGTSSKALLEGRFPGTPQLQIDIAVYTSNGKEVKVVDEAHLAFEPRSLRPVVSVSALRTWAGTGLYWTGTPSLKR